MTTILTPSGEITAGFPAATSTTVRTAYRSRRNAITHVVCMKTITDDAWCPNSSRTFSSRCKDIHEAAASAEKLPPGSNAQIGPPQVPQEEGQHTARDWIPSWHCRTDWFGPCPCSMKSLWLRNAICPLERIKGRPMSPSTPTCSAILGSHRAVPAIRSNAAQIIDKPPALYCKWL